MEEAEFDKFADEYNELYQSVLGPSGESAEFFAEYKIKDTVQLINKYKYPANLSILDFGAGIGTSVPYFLKHLPDCKLTCLDVSRKSLDIGASKFSKRAKFLHFDGKKIPLPDNTFDVVFTACVFHHIPPEAHESLISEIYRILKPGGIFVAFEHNPKNFLTVRAVNACSFDENAILIQGKAFRSLLNNAGMRNEQLHYRIFFPGFLRLLRPLESYLKWLPLGAQYYVYAEKPA
ncbi:MAG: class I SAM-dependent methyltransferase [Xanthomonadales bacterium]|nr:class I SAM-dependent methyltransferase [Xanthomonadales bacterium]